MERQQNCYTSERKKSSRKSRANLISYQNSGSKKETKTKQWENSRIYLITNGRIQEYTKAKMDNYSKE